MFQNSRGQVQAMNLQGQDGFRCCNDNRQSNAHDVLIHNGQHRQNYFYRDTGYSTILVQA